MTNSQETKDIIKVNTSKCYENFINKNVEVDQISYEAGFESGFHCGTLYKDVREVEQITSTELIREMNKRFNGSVLNDLHICKILDTIPSDKVKAYLNKTI